MRLFHRTTRRIALTADGESYFATCAAALEEIASAEASLASQSSLPMGRLRVDMPSSFGRHVILPILLRIGAAHPNLHYTLSFNDHLIDPSQEGIDLTIRFGGLERSGDLVARKLGRQRLVLCASPAYLASQGTPRTIEELHAHRSIVGFRNGQAVAWRFAGKSTDSGFLPQGTHQLADGDAVIEAAIGGLGICQMPISLVRPHIQSGRLQLVLEEFTEHCIEIFALWPRTRHLRPKVRYVVDELVRLSAAGTFD
ncbi:LysR substrate-binding domain-containing protein [Xanthomonas campestris]|uniref:LysR substrate-binding domain-containing protein n=2 Tax=Xanthomonas campestris TaxID=339 RepID=UPI001F16AC5F|nr:LysR substrate-binding domain-containing protein [Xanthomonas campestris]MEA9878478.1 LysR substrate-binding domain-containing protein [Xanthomonas campestris pv. raphani]MEA9894879.1 LysR substrate-binding domain-containing protein [Xanthomonas campestris pv. raphani]MEA9934539.1 LysR substrate-binding domain-containing protein [Xanthomonas campestris pv. raphani]